MHCEEFSCLGISGFLARSLWQRGIWWLAGCMCWWLGHCFSHSVDSSGPTWYLVGADFLYIYVYINLHIYVCIHYYIVPAVDRFDVTGAQFAQLRYNWLHNLQTRQLFVTCSDSIILMFILLASFIQNVKKTYPFFSAQYMNPDPNANKS